MTLYVAPVPTGDPFVDAKARAAARIEAKACARLRLAKAKRTVAKRHQDTSDSEIFVGVVLGALSVIGMGMLMSRRSPGRAASVIRSITDSAKLTSRISRSTRTSRRRASIMHIVQNHTSEESARAERETIARGQRSRTLREARETYAERRFVAVAAIVLLSALVAGAFVMALHFSRWSPLALAVGLWCLAFPTLRRMLDRKTVGL